jgi:prevent-host-death family protein
MSPSSAARSREPVPAFRNRRGEAVEASSVTATDAKKQFGRVLEMVLRGGAVVITKHDAPKAILLSVDEFNALTRTTESKLDSLSADFDAMLARMQTPRARSGMRAAFGASPKALGRAAVTAARKRG